MIADWFRHLNDTRGWNFSIFYDRADGAMFVKGFLVTLELSLACIVLSVLIGALIAFIQRSRIAVLRRAALLYINFFRNTPPLAQLYFFYFGLGSFIVLGSSDTAAPLLDNFDWAVIAMSLFAGAFNAEIFRAGIEAVPRATIEAAEALGYSPLRAYLFIVLPLAVRISLPALNNNLVTMIKGTTLAYAIGVPELLTAASTVWGASVNIPEIMLVLLIVFLAIVGVFVFFMHCLERWLHIPGYSRH